MIGKKLVNIEYISLVNLIMGKEIVQELIQHDLSVEKLKAELQRCLSDNGYIRDMQENYAQLKAMVKLEGAVRETLRMHAPLIHLFRMVKVPISLGP